MCIWTMIWQKKQSCMRSGPNDTKGANIFPTVTLHFITNFDFKIDIKWNFESMRIQWMNEWFTEQIILSTL